MEKEHKYNFFSFLHPEKFKRIWIRFSRLAVNISFRIFLVVFVSYLIFMFMVNSKIKEERKYFDKKSYSEKLIIFKAFIENEFINAIGSQMFKEDEINFSDEEIQFLITKLKSKFNTMQENIFLISFDKNYISISQNETLNTREIDILIKELMNKFSESIIELNYRDKNYYAIKISGMPFYLLISSKPAITKDSLSSTMMIFSIFASLLITFTLFWTIFTRVFIRLQSMDKKLKQIANGDLTVRSNAFGHDEITQIKATKNLLLDNFSKLVKNVLFKMDILKKAGSDLFENIKCASDYVTDISTNVDATKGSISSQTEKVAETSKIATKITNDIKLLNSSIEKQSFDITDTSSSVEKMINDFSKSKQFIENGVGYVESLIQSSEDGSKNLNKVTKLIKQISKNSENLLNANMLIGDVAVQTNVLSINASIEAANSGKENQGFAVVANEIRKLSNMTSAQAENIKNQLNEIISYINAISKESKETNNSFKMITKSVNEVNEIFQEIKSNVESQIMSGSQILLSLQTMKNVSNNVKNDSRNMLEENSVITTTIEKLFQINEKVNSGIEKIIKRTGEINSTVSNIFELGKIAQENISDVSKEAAFFKVE